MKFFVLWLSFIPFGFSVATAADLGDECIGRAVLRAFYLKDSAPDASITFKAWRALGPGEEANKVDVQDVTALPLKILGSGIRSRETGESLAFACVGAPVQAGGEPECDCVRSVYYNSQTRKVYSFGSTRRLYDIAANPNFEITPKYLKKYIHDEIRSKDQVGGGHVYHNRSLKSIFNNAHKFSIRDHWDWSVNPVTVSDHRFLVMTNALNGGRVLAPEKTVRYMQSKGPDSWDMRAFLNPYMIRLIPNHTGHWLN